MKKFFYFLPTLLVMILILYFSSRTGIESHYQSEPLVNFFSFLSFSPHLLTLLVRKTGHILEYGLLTLTSFIFFRYGLKLKYAQVGSMVYSYLFSLVDELFQSFIPLRAGRFSDTLIDLIGILIMSFIIWLIKKTSPR